MESESLIRSIEDFIEAQGSDPELARHAAEHNERMANAKRLFQPDRIPELNTEEIEEFLKNTDAYFGVRGRQRLFRELFGEDGQRLPEVREILGDLVQRAELGLTATDLNEILPKLRYLGPAFLSEILALRFPEKYWIWNGQVRSFLEEQGIRVQDDLPHGKKGDAGQQYFAAGEHLKDLQRALGEGTGRAIHFMDTDLFIYWYNQQEQADPWEGRIAKWLKDEFPSERLGARIKGEAEARAILDSKAGRFAEEDLREFANKVNADWYSGSDHKDRFMPALYGHLVNQMVEALDEFNTWVSRLWNADDGKEMDVLGQFWEEADVPGAGTSMPSSILYLKDPAQFNVWIPVMEEGLGVAAGYKPGSSRRAKSYNRYNQALIQFRNEYELEPQALDVILWRFAKLQDAKESTLAFPGFVRDTFQFLRDLAANNSVEWMKKDDDTEKERYQKVLREPLRDLFESVAPTIRAIDPSFETDAKFGKVLAGIYKRFPDDEGAYYPYLWGAFYRKGRKKQTDAQLFVNVQPDHVNVGLGVAGSRGTKLLEVFYKNLETHPELFLDLIRSLPEGVQVKTAPAHGSMIKEVIKLEASDDLERLRESRLIDIERQYPEDDQILYESDFALSVAQLFEELYPLYQFVTAESTEDLELIQPLDPEPEIVDTEGRDQYSHEELLADTFLDDAYIRHLEALLLDKKQVIFVGPPGTGKTWIAMKFAQYWMESAPNPDGTVQTIQFHPSYAYEEFMEGIRPESVETDDGRHELNYPVRPGLFREFCDVARRQPNRRHVLIIDEINRGELPRIFGELLYLLEYRQQVINLPYSKVSFSIPPNVFLIGTMNTADRSIALVDHALRRRFHFITLKPDSEILRSFYQANGSLELMWVADLLDLANQNLDSDGVDWHLHIGHSHFMRDDLDISQLKLVWDHSIMPTLEEYFYRQPEKLEAYELEVLLDALGISA